MDYFCGRRRTNKFCYCRNRRRALWRKHSILLEKWIKQYKLGRIRQVAILNSPVVTSWRTESSNISLVVLDKLLYYSRNLVFFIFQNFLKTDRPTDQPTDQPTNRPTLQPIELLSQLKMTPKLSLNQMSLYKCSCWWMCNVYIAYETNLYNYLVFKLIPSLIYEAESLFSTLLCDDNCHNCWSSIIVA